MISKISILVNIKYSPLKNKGIHKDSLMCKSEGNDKMRHHFWSSVSHRQAIT